MLVYRHKSWGKFRVQMTNDANTVEMRLENAERGLGFPDAPQEFVKELRGLLRDRLYRASQTEKKDGHRHLPSQQEGS